MLIRLIAIVAAVLIGSCTSVPRSSLHRQAAVAAFKAFVSEYNAMPPQFDDPTGRNYCLGFSETVRGVVRPIPSVLFAQLRDQPGVQSPLWCAVHPHRVLVLGSISRVGASRYRFFEASWVTTRTHSAAWRYREYVLGPEGVQLLPPIGGGVSENNLERPQIQEILLPRQGERTAELRHVLLPYGAGSGAILGDRAGPALPPNNALQRTRFARR